MLTGQATDLIAGNVTIDHANTERGPENATGITTETVNGSTTKNVSATRSVNVWIVKESASLEE